jgi:hypothetical protein
MLTFDQFRIIAAHVGMGYTTEDAAKAVEYLNSGHMGIDVDFFYQDPESDHGNEENPGFYARLSAPGYMDCTDWSGPFETEEEAVAELIKLYDCEG